jgi:hypothetical protein
MPVKVICPGWAVNMIGVQVGWEQWTKPASEVLFLEAGEIGCIYVTHFQVALKGSFLFNGVSNWDWKPKIEARTLSHLGSILLGVCRILGLEKLYAGIGNVHGNEHSPVIKFMFDLVSRFTSDFSPSYWLSHISPYMTLAFCYHYLSSSFFFLNIIVFSISVLLLLLFPDMGSLSAYSLGSEVLPFQFLLWLTASEALLWLLGLERGN